MSITVFTFIVIAFAAIITVMTIKKVENKYLGSDTDGMIPIIVSVTAAIIVCIIILVVYTCYGYFGHIDAENEANVEYEITKETLSDIYYEDENGNERRVKRSTVKEKKYDSDYFEPSLVKAVKTWGPIKGYQFYILKSTKSDGSGLLQ